MNDLLLVQYAEICEWAPASFLFISENVFDPLIYYSHLLPILLSLPLAFIILIQAPKQSLNRLFFLMVGLFSVWAISDLILWAHPDPSVIMFFWSLLILIEPILYISAFLFVHNALYGKPLNILYTGSLSLLLLPTIILLPTKLAIQNFDLTNCWREVVEGPLVFYGYAIQVSVLILIIGNLIYALVHRRDETKRRISAVVGTVLFLLIFSFGNIIGSFTEDWTIGQYGLFGMPLLVVFISYSISKYKIFQSKIISTELLVGALAILTISASFVQSLKLVKSISYISFILVLILGALLVRSVRKEVAQRNQMLQLTKKLERANKRLKILDQMKSEFVSIASHQLRSPLTSIRGYASMLLEGSYGKLPDKAREAIERIQESSRFMALSVEDYLDVSRIQAGNMKYEMSDFNLATEASHIVDDIRSEAVKKGLVLSYKSDMKKQGIVHADLGKTRQILHNLINNALKYTPKGSIVVFAHDDKKKMFVDVIDTGIGMSEETKSSIFAKFERARNANEVNVTGTGLGLYVAHKMAEEMGGEVTGFSDGEGKGSTFRIELPLQM